MEIRISSSQTLQQVKDAFHELLPFMKIEFFKHSHHEGEGSPKSDMIQGDLLIGDLVYGHEEGTISFDWDTKVFELEEKLNEYFGLNVQIFRKSGNLYLESTISDEWSLSRVKEEAEEFNEL